MKFPVGPGWVLALLLALVPAGRVLGQDQAGQNQSSIGSNASSQRQARQPSAANSGRDQQTTQGASANNAQGPSQNQGTPAANANGGQSGTGNLFFNTQSGLVPVLPALNGSQNVDWQYRWQILGQEQQPQSFAFAWVDQASRNSGMTLAPADAALRAHLKLPEEQGLIVTAVEPGSPAAAVGIQQNDVLIRAVHDQNHSCNLGKPEDLEAALKKIGERPITIGLLRGGQTTTLKVQPRVHASLGPVRPEPNPYRIGVSVGPVEPALRAQLQLPDQNGLIVLEVEKDGPAARAGVRRFDILRKFDGVELVDQAGLTKLVQSRAGKAVTLELLREGRPQELSLAPERRQDSLNINVDYQTDGAFDLILTSPGGALTQPGRLLVGPGGQWIADVTNMRLNDGGAGANAGDTVKAKPDGDASIAKRLDDLSGQIKELRQAIESLAKAQEKK